MGIYLFNPGISRGDNYYPTRGYSLRPNPVGSALKFVSFARRVGTGMGLDAGRVKFGFKANSPYPTRTHIYIVLCLVENKDRYKKFLVCNFSYEDNL